LYFSKNTDFAFLGIGAKVEKIYEFKKSKYAFFAKRGGFYKKKDGFCKQKG